MQSSHTCHVNKTNFKTLTVLRRITLRSGYCRIMFFSARRCKRGRWTTGGTTGTATATGARVCGVNTRSSSSLSDSRGRWPLVQHTDCGCRRWPLVPAGPWCALGPPAVGVEVCVCTAGPQEWSLRCGVDGGRLLCSPGLACPWWSQQHALSAVLAVVSVGCWSRRRQDRERGLRVLNHLNGRQSLLHIPCRL